MIVADRDGDIVSDGHGRTLLRRLRSLNPAARLAAVLIALVLVGMWGVFAAVTQASLREHRAVAAAYAANVAALLAVDLGHTFETYDLSLRGLIADLADPALAALPLDLRRKAIFDASTYGSAFGAMLVTDKDGRLVEDSRTVVVPKIDVSDRDYFKAQRDGTVDGVFLSHPYVSRVNGERMVGMSRRVEKGGRFAGVALGTMKLDGLRDLFDQVRLPPGSMVALRYDDGSTLVSLTSGGSPEPGAKRATSRGGALSAEHKVIGLPLVEVVTIPGEAVYRSFWRDTEATAAGFAVLSLIILALGATLLREGSRRDAAEARLRHMASIDGLTGLANRWRFDEALQREAARAERHGTALSLLLVDVDLFKHFNDSYGHSAGDAALRRIASVLRESVSRPGDVAARIGGEEFALLLPDTGEDGARLVADRLVRAVRAIALPHVATARGLVTISVGLASAGGRVRAGGLYDIADIALYRAKHEGRDRFETGSSGDDPPTAADAA